MRLVPSEGHLGSPRVSEGAGGYRGAIPAVPPGVVPHPGVPGLARGEPQGMGGIKGTGGLLPSAFVLFQCNLKAERLQGEMASAPAGFAPHLRSWPAAGRAACFCLYT